MSLVAGSPTPAVEAIADALDEGVLTLRSSSVGISAVRGVDAQTARRCAEAFTQLKDDLDGPALALALRVATGLRGVERLARPEIEIVWTGPEAEGPLVRPTTAVIEEMLRGVREAGEVLTICSARCRGDGRSSR